MIRQNLMNTLENEKLFDAFMDSLFGEYCAECLLSIVEFIQFKQRVVRDNDDDGVEFEENKLKLFGSITKSVIVYNDDDDYKEIVNKLYGKYIKIGSEWEINIDYTNRNRYMNLIENNTINYEDIEMVYTLFDACIDNMVGLIIPAFTRFKNSKKYQVIKHYEPPSPSGGIELV